MAERAKTPSEKRQVLKRLYRLWLKNPNLRFTQLLENVFHHTSPDHCFYFTEDFPLCDALEKYYKTKDEKIVN